MNIIFQQLSSRANASSSQAQAFHIIGNLYKVSAAVNLLLQVGDSFLKSFIKLSNTKDLDEDPKNVQVFLAHVLEISI